MVHPIIVGVYRWTGCFQSTMWESRGLPLGEIRRGSVCLCPFKVFALKRGWNNFQGPFNFGDVHFNITYRIILIWRCSNTKQRCWGKREWWCDLLDRCRSLTRKVDCAAEKSDLERGIYGTGAHSDYGLITLLATDNVHGLQVLAPKPLNAFEAWFGPLIHSIFWNCRTW